MKRNYIFLFAFSPLLFVSGCWTVKETPHPSVPVTALPAGKDVRVRLAGFDATVTSYDAAYSYSTVSGWDPWGGRRGWGGWRTTTYSTTSFVPRTERTSAFRDRAQDAFEQAGCILKTSDPQYQVEVRFAGPFSEDGDGWATLGWMVLTAFTAEYGGQTWTAQLRVHDLKSGKLVLSKDFSERDEAVVWGLIPIFSPVGSDRNSDSVMKHLCLTALTDKAVAESVAFLAGLK